MKTNKFLIYALLGVFFASCSNDSDLQLETQNDSIVALAESEPYISPQLQAIFDMADTCTTGIPLEVIFPNIDILLDSSSVDTSAIKLRSLGDYVSTVGASSYVVSEIKVPITITAVQALNLNFPGSALSSAPVAGTYYATVYIATLNVVNPGGVPYPDIYSSDVLGINPDNFEEQGFAVQEVSPKVYYKLTTYLWAIHSVNTSGQVLDDIFYVIPCYKNVPDAYDANPTYIIKNLLTWKYIVI